MGDVDHGRRELEERLLGQLPDPEPDQDDEEAQLVEAIRAEARAHFGLAPAATLEEIQEAFAGSLWDFWLFFFPDFRRDEKGREVPSAEIHVELVRDLQALVIDGRPGEQMARAYPREHAKSVFGSLVTPAWALASRHRRFAILFSDTARQAEEFADDIRVEVETNERLQAIYPELCEWEREPRANRLMFGNGAVLMAAGSGKSVRGARKGAQRPDFIVLDDIENDEEVENPQRRKKKMRWHNRVVKKLGRAAVIAILGTILHAESFLAQQVTDDSQIHAALVEEPANKDLWTEWESRFHDRSLPDSEGAARAFYEANRAAMDVGAVVLWPERFGLYGLMVERAEDLASFLSERQNRPFDPSASWFPEDRITWLDHETRPPDTDIVLSVAFWDPARGTSKGDTSSLCRLDCYEDGRRHVRESETDRVPPETIMETGIGMHLRRPFDVWGVEKVGLSSYDEDLEAMFLARELRSPVEPHTPSGRKELRIRSLRPSIVSGGLTFDESLPLEAKRQLKFYPSHPNDDFPDAVEAANKIADEHLRDVEPASGHRDAEAEDLVVDRRSVLGRGTYTDDVEERPAGLGGRILNLLGRRA